MLGAALTFLAGSQFDSLIKHFAVPLPLNAAAAFVGFFSVISQSLAAVVALFSIYALAVSLQKREDLEETAQPGPPLAPLLVRSQYPCAVLGAAAAIAVVVAYMLKQGTDLRHFYLIGMSLLGLGAMFVIGAVAFAVVHGPVKKSSRPQAQSQIGMRIGVSLLQALGVAAVICCLTVLLSYLLAIFR